MISQPLYEPGDIVYLRESAALGFLEAVQINNLMYGPNGWVYTVRTKPSQPIAPSHYGDRVMLVNGATLYFSEDEFVTVCDAQSLVEANLQAQLDRVRAQRSSQCTDITAG